MGNNSVPKFIFRLSRFPVYRGSVLGRFYCTMNDLSLNEHIRDIQIMYYFLLVPVIAVEGVSLGVIHSVHKLILIFRISD